MSDPGVVEKLERARQCSVHHYSVRVAVVIGGMPLLPRNQTWLDKTVLVQAADMDAAYEPALEIARKTEPPEGFTVLGACVIGCSWEFWRDGT